MMNELTRIMESIENEQTKGNLNSSLSLLNPANSISKTIPLYERPSCLLELDEEFQGIEEIEPNSPNQL